MNEPEVIYQYSMLQLKAESIKHYLTASRDDFVLRHIKTNQPFARCATLAEMGKQIANFTLLRNLNIATAKGALR